MGRFFIFVFAVIAAVSAEGLQSKNYGALGMLPKGVAQFDFRDTPVVWKYHPQEQISSEITEKTDEKTYLTEGFLGNEKIGKLKYRQLVSKISRDETRFEAECTILSDNVKKQRPEPWFKIDLPIDIYRNRIAADGIKFDSPRAPFSAKKLEIWTEGGKMTVSGDMKIHTRTQVKNQTVDYFGLSILFNPLEEKGKYALKLDFKLDRDVPPPPLPDEFTVGKNGGYAEMPVVRKIEKGGPLDFSFLLDAPAGKYGFVKVKNDRFRFEKAPKKKIRFFGTNIGQKACIPTHEEAVALADELAASGYNTARPHQFENFIWRGSPADTVSYKSNMLDRLDFLFSELFKRGIYLTIDFYASGKFSPRDYDDIKYRGDNMKAIIFASDKARAALKRHIKNFLEHINPYTGRAYKDEPAIVFASIINEDNVVPTSNFVVRTQLDRDLFKPIYNKWLSANSEKYNGKSDSWKFQKFLLDRYDEVVGDVRAFVKTIAPHILITDQTNASGALASAMADSFDVVDWHSYNGHPKFYARRFSRPMQIPSDSSLKSFGGSFVKQMLKHNLDRPSTVTEWDFVRPNPHAAEGGLIVGAYSALNEIDGLYHFSYSHDNEKILANKTLGGFDTAGDAVRTLSDKIGAMLYNCTRKSKTVFVNVIDKNIFENANSQNLYRLPSELAKFGLIGRVGNVVVERCGDIEDKIHGASTINLVAENRELLPKKLRDEAIDPYAENAFELVLKNAKLGNGSYDPQEEVFISSTNQLFLYNKRGAWKAITPKCEAFVQNSGETLEGDFAKVENTSGWSTVALAAIDGKKLSESRRITIAHLTNLMNKGQKFGDKKMTVIISNGTPPYYIRAAKSTVEIKSPLEGFKCYALDTAGRHIAEIPISHKDGKSEISLSTHNSFGQTIAYELTAMPQN